VSSEAKHLGIPPFIPPNCGKHAQRGIHATQPTSNITINSMRSNYMNHNGLQDVVDQLLGKPLQPKFVVKHINIIERPAKKIKPTRIEVVRYYRPRYYDCTPIGNKGATVVFYVDYNQNMFTIAFALCNGDTFSKIDGLSKATSIDNQLRSGPYDLDKSRSLYDNLVLALVSHNKLDKDHRRLLKQLMDSENFKTVYAYEKELFSDVVGLTRNYAKKQICNPVGMIL
jgi:hypothetical protein